MGYRLIRKLDEMADEWWNDDHRFASLFLRVHQHRGKAQDCWESAVEMVLDTDAMGDLQGSAAVDKAELLAIHGLWSPLLEKPPGCGLCGKVGDGG